jgi:hypothetical protein
MTLPPGWTDDMNIVLPEERSLEEVVELVISMGRQRVAHEVVQSSLIETFCLSPDDAALAWDRVHGGIVRASTGHQDNCPDRRKDTLAWMSFQRASQDWSIVADLYPQYAKSRRVGPESARPENAKQWWKFW